MAQLVDNLAYHLDVASSDDDKRLPILDNHIHFICILRLPIGMTDLDVWH